VSIVSAELFSDAGNAAVVRLPGRKNAGVVVQGDTLKILVDLVQESLDAVKGGHQFEAKEGLEQILSQLADM